MNRARRAWYVVVLTVVASGCVSFPTRRELAEMPGPHSEQTVAGSVGDGRGRFRDIFCGILAQESSSEGGYGDCSGWLWQLSDDQHAEHRPPPAPDKSPQIYLVTGAFGQCLGDHGRPFESATERLVAGGYRIAAIVVGGRSGIEHNAREIADRIANRPPGEEGPVILIGYSKGANDILEFLVRYPELAGQVDSVVSVAGAIAGSPLAERFSGLYDLLLSRLPNHNCPRGDGKVIASLRSDERLRWLEANRLPPSVQYFSIAAFTTRPRVAAALVPAWKSLLRRNRRNDGQLLPQDSLIPGSTLLGYIDADHWSAAIDLESTHPSLGARRDSLSFPRAALLEAILLQVGESRRARNPAKAPGGD